MSVEIEFIDQSRPPARFTDMQISDAEAHTYCYELLPQGAVVVYRSVHELKEGVQHGFKSEEVAVYGPAAWCSAQGQRHVL
ncbi:hypothetical protein [Streptomyces antimycoticus]|uniref:hypothetical protein n=1 Tax=Streptomyces antimycoticus TaxID=68175 RepID=UPI000A3C1294|nr:hypothetical protein [Streptomyces antimycoticus]